MGGVVRMEATQRDGLWEIETVGKPRAFLAVKPTGVERVGEPARKGPGRMMETKKVPAKPVKVIEVDLELDDEGEATPTIDVSVGETETPMETKTEERGAAEAAGARGAEAVGARGAEAVGARAMGETGDKKEELMRERVMSPETGGKSYSERARVVPTGYGEANEGWVAVTPKAKKKMGAVGASTRTQQLVRVGVLDLGVVRRPNR